MRIAVTGASGLIGTRLVAALRGDGHQVVRLVRHAPTSPEEAQWDPATGTVDAGALTGTDAVVHLSGANVGGQRWTPAYKDEILRSRVDSTRTIATALAGLAEKPAVLVSASAIGWYGDTADRAVDESTAAGRGYFPDVVRQWEEATAPAADAGIRVVRLRTGLVIGREGGLLGMPAPLPAVHVSLLQLFRLGLGGVLGNGRQWMSWISLDDEIAAIRFLLEANVSGPVNLTAPQPVTNKEFTHALAHAVHRPALARVPASAIKLLAGEFGDEIVISQRVLPRALQEAGFAFTHPTIDRAIAVAVS